MGKYIRYLVLSDLHAFADVAPERSPSALSSTDGSGFPEHLFRRCAELVADRFGTIEAILVAGDMVDRADKAALPFVWRLLNDLGAQLKAPVIATAGNHDVDARGIYSDSPNEALMNLDPPFPAGTSGSRRQYFSEHHSLEITENSAVLTINSSAHHGLAPSGVPEDGHGRISASLPAWIKRTFDESGPLPAMKVLLTHHQPLQLPDFDTDETSTSLGSDRMFRVLSHHGDWLVVHGHKHRGWTHYGYGGGDAPVIFSSSSFSANLGDDEFARLVERQFHVIEVHDPNGPSGLIYSWNHDGSDWTPAAAKHMLPGVSGFGWRTSLNGIASELRSALEPDGVLDSSSIQALMPRLQYLTFDDRARLLRRLEEGTPQVGHLLAPNGEIDELHVRTT